MEQQKKKNQNNNKEEEEEKEDDTTHDNKSHNDHGPVNDRRQQLQQTNKQKHTNKCGENVKSELERHYRLENEKSWI